MTDDEQIREITSRITALERHIHNLGMAGLMVAQQLDAHTEWMQALSVRIDQLEKKNGYA